MVPYNLQLSSEHASGNVRQDFIPGGNDIISEYEAAAVALKEWNIPLLKVDGTREKELADQFQIVGWPEIKMFRKGRLYPYKGPREQDNIIAYMKDQVRGGILGF